MTPLVDCTTPFTDAVQILESTCDVLMTEFQWHSIAVMEGLSECEYYLLAWTSAEDLQAEMDVLHRKGKNYLEIVEANEDFIKCFLKTSNPNIEQQAIELIIQLPPPQQFKSALGSVANCDHEEPRKIGDLLKNQNGDGVGSVGCFIVSQEGTVYAVTAYHVVANNDSNQSSLGNVIESPPHHNQELGILRWYAYDDRSDIALIEISDGVRVTNQHTCCFPLSKKFGKAPKAGEKVKICSGIDDLEVKTAKVESPFVVAWVFDGAHQKLMKGLTRTSDLGVNGDSGSIVVNSKNEAVGLLIGDTAEEYSYFMSLDILRTEIEIPQLPSRTSIAGSSGKKTFQFKEFH